MIPVSRTRWRRRPDLGRAIADNLAENFGLSSQPQVRPEQRQQHMMKSAASSELAWISSQSTEIGSNRRTVVERSNCATFGDRLEVRRAWVQWAARERDVMQVGVLR